MLNRVSRATRFLALSIVRPAAAAATPVLPPQLPYLERKAELALFQDLLTSKGDWTKSEILVGPRHAGKTSLLKKALSSCSEDVRARTLVLNLKHLAGEDESELLCDYIHQSVCDFAIRHPLAVLASVASLNPEDRVWVAAKFQAEMAKAGNDTKVAPALDVQRRRYADSDRRCYEVQ
eukprot:TRINITY_DN744_c0_g1_i3.p1 TRINITY_DN744_c0_g1~~TRINITY_DN744_c0_g1_i3.p1  ORF type:complete len:178 (+),score=28.36 TRINITY_DN744_c0_g1_i3:32-565(+)